MIWLNDWDFWRMIGKRLVVQRDASFQVVAVNNFLAAQRPRKHLLNYCHCLPVESLCNLYLVKPDRTCIYWTTLVFCKHSSAGAETPVNWTRGSGLSVAAILLNIYCIAFHTIVKILLGFCQFVTIFTDDLMMSLTILKQTSQVIKLFLDLSRIVNPRVCW